MNLNPAGWPAQLLRLVARLRSDGVNTAIPVTEINGGNLGATDADIALVAKGSGATLAEVPDGAASGGNKRGQFATDFQKSRTSANHVASGVYSVLAGGFGNEASGNSAFCGAGQTNLASGNSSVVSGGQANTASGFGSCIGGGQGNNAIGSYSCILGGRQGTTRSISGNHVFPACNVPISNSAGVTQAGLLLLGRQTTNATPTTLTSDTSAAGTGNQVALPANSAYSFFGEVIAGVTGGGDTARWTINGAIKRGATAASTVMVGTPTVAMTHNDAGAAAWTVAVTADTTNGAIAVTVTGAASTTIRWVAKINTTEMTY